MKRPFLFALIVLLALPCAAQVEIPGITPSKEIKPWRVKRTGISMGMDFDMIGRVNHQYFTQKINSPVTANFAAIQGLGVEDVDESWCENPYTRVQVNLEAGHLKNVELALAASFIVGRSDGINYYDPVNNRSLNISAYGDEIGLEAAILKAFPLGNVLRLYGGLGTNLGYTFNNNVSIHGLNQWTVNDGEAESNNDPYGYDWYDHGSEHFSMTDGLSQRVFATAGLTFVLFRRLELGAEARRGIGYRWHFQDDPIFTHLNSFGFVARWQWKSRL